ncbi:uncharacterized protein LOC116580871 [Mustela erminea]|uniref:uncharacterized protein LOC116580871 n=1 Tax=Mustela erminea TaxID=36723 RepID=UPI0013870BF9|nr:uncharacterized protein LOC116580871 [Mustela erminea]
MLPSDLWQVQPRERAPTGSSWLRATRKGQLGQPKVGRAAWGSLVSSPSQEVCKLRPRWLFIVWLWFQSRCEQCVGNQRSEILTWGRLLEGGGIEGWQECLLRGISIPGGGNCTGAGEDGGWVVEAGRWFRWGDPGSGFKLHQRGGEGQWVRSPVEEEVPGRGKEGVPTENPLQVLLGVTTAVTRAANSGPQSSERLWGQSECHLRGVAQPGSPSQALAPGVPFLSSALMAWGPGGECERPSCQPCVGETPRLQLSDFWGGPGGGRSELLDAGEDPSLFDGRAGKPGPRPSSGPDPRGLWKR